MCRPTLLCRESIQRNTGSPNISIISSEVHKYPFRIVKTLAFLYLANLSYDFSSVSRSPQAMSMSNHEQVTSSSGRQTPSTTVVPFSLFSQVGDLTTLRPCTSDVDHSYNTFKKCFSFTNIPITESWCIVGARHQDLCGWLKCYVGFALHPHDTL